MASEDEGRMTVHLDTFFSSLHLDAITLPILVNRPSSLASLSSLPSPRSMYFFAFDFI